MPDCLIAAAATPAIPIHAVTPATLDAFLAEAGASVAGWVAESGFSAAAGKVLALPGPDGRRAAVLFGLGDAATPGPLIAGALSTALPAGDYRLASGFDDPTAAALAFALGAYRFTRYRAGEAPPRLVVPEGVDAGRVGRIADGVHLARDLVNTAANDLGPAELAEAAEELAERHGAALSVTTGDALAEGFPMVHAVGAAAVPARGPRLIDITWGDAAAPKVTLVGKGVCFDTGGLDLKPSAGMLLMKKDMGGAANVLGLAHMVMAAGLPVRLRVLIPAVENAVSGIAFRPGDVLRSRKGLTVEIGNTDAEGRLVLADALALAGEEAPELLFDMATLTGAARVALGPEVAPFYTADERLAEGIQRHGEIAGDPVWRMPLWTPYMSMLDSKVADINNAGATPFAGSITAALFLSRFVPDGVSWLHADIFAWTPVAKPGRPFGGEANAIRAFYSFLEERYGA
ncbi:MAG: leucyl aminopeptidase family protein [Bauldia sp.]|uniref:leucyl aminopeptidase family protein n=1 Tax=Bauldia sp. TaxID=2575872 RepID=UPI001D54D206|nr:leucyl aminopeptidase family protein [Bauldia sp.]MCB1496741.1 leucyl aminopeptidase family protein [Bauldia sp.]